MLKAVANILFSMKLTALLLLIFAIAIGTATFIENDFGTPAAKTLIYNARWFEMVIFLLTINLIGNLFRYKLFQLKKLPSLTFHLAFIIIVIGAAITRYISYEGLMHIREGEASNQIISDNTFLQIHANDNKTQYNFNKKLFLSPAIIKPFNHSFKFNGKKVNIAYKNFIPNAIDTILKDENGRTTLELITTDGNGRISNYLQEATQKRIGFLDFAFNEFANPNAFLIYSTDTGLVFKSPVNVSYMKMSDQSKGTVKADSIAPFMQRALYSIGNMQLVFKAIHKGVKLVQKSVPKERKKGEDILVVDVTVDNKTKTDYLPGGKGYVSDRNYFELNGLNFALAYGSIAYETPFYIQLDDFVLERYPGSQSPSSYSSHVTVIDDKNNQSFKHHIYMNNVLDYQGFRFFQSSYDQDEKGTVLSVNHDMWGTTITYIGYFLLFLGMLLTLFFRSTRFRTLANKIRKTTTILVLLVVSSLQLNANQNNIKDFVVDKKHAEYFSTVLVQDQSGRIKPIHTLASEVLRKVNRSTKFDNQNPTQVFLGMTFNPMFWQGKKMIKVNHDQLKEKLGIEGKYAAYFDFFDKDFKYLLHDEVEAANQKKPAYRNKYDKELIAVDERVNICSMVYSGAFLRIFPLKGDKNNTWFGPLEGHVFKGDDSLFVNSILGIYYHSLINGVKTNNWQEADSIVNYIKQYQEKFGSEVIPDKSKVKLEITYNKLMIFKHLFEYYSLVGLLLLIFLLIDLFHSKKWLNGIIIFLTSILVLFFIIHTVGLGMRWYISGHAPWSNAYESMIFIAWATVLAGFIFSRKSKLTLAATAILASLTLMVAHLNWLDPEITPLVPVLKSYWLMIHVAVITSSYGFLALGALLGFLNLCLMMFKNAKNYKTINHTVTELTYINEMTLEIGLFMATIGTFLGGVWANESWGRYWGWDPKETWALVIVLVYAMVLHFRFIPSLKGKYTFNLSSLLAYSTVIMTYFGVNYYLSGLHSYAKGDPVPIPAFVYYTLGVIFIVATIAYFKNKKSNTL
ncbi:MAG: cytochrome c biogenesis protein CcsA [Vicingaceae bacterium]